MQWEYRVGTRGDNEKANDSSMEKRVTVTSNMLPGNEIGRCKHRTGCQYKTWWHDSIMNVHTSTENKLDDTKDSFYEQIDH